MSPRDIMPAQYAKASDPSSGGRQMPGHYGDRRHNIVSVSLAGRDPDPPCRRHRAGGQDPGHRPGRDDGRWARVRRNQGDVHEGLNFAAIHKLPFVFVVENNGYAISVPAARELAVQDVAMRAAGYGIPGVIVDGSDVLACYAAAQDAVARARAGDGPTLIEAKVTRLTAHSSDDQQTKYRSEEELAEEKGRDAAAPVPRPAPGRRRPDAEPSRPASPPSSRPLVDDATDYAEAAAGPGSVDRDALGLRRGLAVRESAAVGHAATGHASSAGGAG